MIFHCFQMPCHFAATVVISFILLTTADAESPDQWKQLETIGKPHARHEAAFVNCDGRLYLLGGRGVKPVDIFDPETRTWTEGARSPLEIHHFQPVVWQNRILIAGAMTGQYPHETALDRILIYEPKEDRWSWGAEIPEDRRRGGAGAAIFGNNLYLVCGIQNGHWDGWSNWLDRFDLESKTWEVLADAPRVRDHFQAEFIGKKLYAPGGRKTSGTTKQVFDLTISEVDVYDIPTKTWSTLPAESNLPIPRAGCFSFAIGTNLFVAGGESMTQRQAHNEVQMLDTTTGKWMTPSVFATGRHGTDVVQWQNSLYTAAGSGGRGGGPELDTTERLELNTPR